MVVPLHSTDIQLSQSDARVNQVVIAENGIALTVALPQKRRIVRGQKYNRTTTISSTSSSIP